MNSDGDGMIAHDVDQGNSKHVNICSKKLLSLITIATI